MAHCKGELLGGLSSPCELEGGKASRLSLKEFLDFQMNPVAFIDGVTLDPFSTMTHFHINSAL